MSPAWRAPLLLALLAAATALLCGILLPATGLLPPDSLAVAAVVLILAWTMASAWRVWSGYQLARALDSRCVAGARNPTGVAYRIVLGAGRRAFVLGTLAPRIYVGDGLIAALDADELRAVVLHEEHHRRTRAPLRAAALEGWLAILPWHAWPRSALGGRLVDLEQAADAEAVRRGATPAALASALLHADPEAGHVSSFASAATQRLQAVTALGDGSARRGAPPLPYEWLLPVGLVVVAIVCHLSGLSPLR